MGQARVKYLNVNVQKTRVLLGGVKPKSDMYTALRILNIFSKPMRKGTV